MQQNLGDPPNYGQLPPLSDTIIERARTLWRNLAWTALPEAFGAGVEGDHVPNAADASTLAMVRGLHGDARAQDAAAGLTDARSELRGLLEKGPVDVLAPNDEDNRPGSRLDLACELLDVDDTERLVLELIVATHADAVTAHAARTLAGRLGYAANHVGVLNECMSAADLGTGSVLRSTGTSGELVQVGAVVASNGLVRPSDALLSFLDGEIAPRAELSNHEVRVQVPDAAITELARIRQRWIAVLDRAIQGSRPVLLSGMSGFGAPILAGLLAGSQGLLWRGIHAAPLVDAETGDPTELVPILHAEARLSGALTVIHRLDRLRMPLTENSDAIRRLVTALAAIERPLILAWEGPLPHEVAASFAIDGGILHIEVPPLTVDERRELVAACLRASSVPDEAADELAQTAGAYSLGTEQIAAAVAFAQQRASLRAAAAVAEEREAGPEHPTPSELALACNTAMTNRLRMYGSRVQTSATWDDLVLAEEPLAQIKEIARFARVRNRLFDNFGFAEKMDYGRALSAMFSGHSGTGKTMVAGLIARDLGVELYRVDLSRVVSKYIGETEQRLGALFDEAGQVGAALLFDEADSLFGKRTEIKSSHDRYANLEVNYLLQRLEDFDGVVILTTNFASSIDEAFVRRLRFRVQFPFPSAADRARLWDVMIPERLPRSEDDPLDLDWTGENFELTGGHVKNAVLRAGMMAADGEGELTMRMLYDAAAAEYRELGKIAPPYPFDEDDDEDW